MNPNFPVSGMYEGELEDGQPNGRGVLKPLNELHYDGEWQHGQPHGRGRLSFPEWGFVYDGQFERGLFIGQGVLTIDTAAESAKESAAEHWANVLKYGSRFEGEWKDGTLEYKPGHCVSMHNKLVSIYVGDVVNGRREGQGDEFVQDGTVYKGQWKDNQRHGQGSLEDNNKGTFVGAFHHGKKHGRGEIKSSDGEVVEAGEYREDQLHGRGIQVDNNMEYTYEGEFVAGKPHGQGTSTAFTGAAFSGQWIGGILQESDTKLRWAYGQTYEGAVKDGQPHGYGTLWWDNGGESVMGYKGEWLNGLRQGQDEWRDNYDGEWKGDQRHGRGTMCFANGNRYEGEWEKDEMIGKGTYFYAGGPYFWLAAGTYVGSFLANVPHGVGKRVCFNGRQYHGDWKNDFQDGHGEETSASGEHYVGGWKTDSRDGSGRCTFVSGYVYQGQWANGRAQGQGTSTAPDGSTTSGVWNSGVLQESSTKLLWPNGDVYEGAVQDGKAHGRGKLHLLDGPHPGLIYEGDFVSGMYHGQGMLSRPDGYKYVGEFRATQFRSRHQHGAFHGQGALTTADKHSFTGQFVDGKCHGQGELTTPAGVKHKGPWISNWIRLADGRFISRDGARYSGEEKGGLPHGKGEVHHADGSTSRGQFVAGVQEGVGQHQHQSGALFEGDFKAGDGIRGIRWPAPGGSSDASRQCGHWRNDKLVLPAPVPRRILTEGSRLSEHERNASLLFPDGSYFIGPLNRHDQAHGQGKLFRANGDELQSGTWIHGTFQAPAPPPPEGETDAGSAACSSPPGGSPVVSSCSDVEGTVAPLVDAAALQQEVARLRAVMAEQAKEISELKRRLA